MPCGLGDKSDLPGIVILYISGHDENNTYVGLLRTLVCRVHKSLTGVVDEG